MSAYPILYSFRRCPYAIRARMALKRAAVTCELREVMLRDKPEEMMAISRKGTVPVLQLPDGEVMDESLDVMRWALRWFDPDNWLVADEQQTRELVTENDFNFKEKLDRYKYFERYPEHSQKYYREAAESFLASLEERLSTTKGKALTGDYTSLADVAIFPFIRQFARVDWEWFCQSPYQLLRDWLTGFEQGELFLSVMTKYPVWKKGDPIILFA